MKKAGRYITMTSSFANSDTIKKALRKETEKKAEQDKVKIVREIFHEKSVKMCNGSVLTMITLSSYYEAA